MTIKHVISKSSFNDDADNESNASLKLFHNGNSSSSSNSSNSSSSSSTVSNPPPPPSSHCYEDDNDDDYESMSFELKKLNHSMLSFSSCDAKSSILSEPLLYQKKKKHVLK